VTTDWEKAGIEGPAQALAQPPPHWPNLLHALENFIY
jgi:hypothetical protein